MKKLRILPVLMTLALVIAGCKGPSVPMPESASHVDLEREVVLSGTMSDGESRWKYRITTYTVSGEHCAQDGTERVLTRHSYQTPTMEVFRAEDGGGVSPAALYAAEEFNAYFRQVLQEDVAWFDEMAVAADEDYSMSRRLPDSVWNDEAFAYSDQATLDFWSNGRLVCVTTSRYTDTGGAHPNAWRSAVTFDLHTGRTVTAADLTDDPEVLRSAVERELLRQAQERQTGEDNEAADTVPAYYEDYPETLGEWMDRALIFDDRGMTVVFSVYDIAPYSDGEQTFLIPYGDLAPYLNQYGRSVLELPD